MSSHNPQVAVSLLQYSLAVLVIAHCHDLQVSSIGDAKKQSRSKTRQAADDTAPTTSAEETAFARLETSSSQPYPRPAGGVWRAPSRRLHSLQPDRGAEPGAGLWTMATTLGVIVFFGRVTAVIFLCSCLYGARFVRAQAGGAAKAKSAGIAGGGSRRFGHRVAERVVVDLCTDEHKKKVVMEGLLDRAGTRPSSRFCK